MLPPLAPMPVRVQLHKTAGLQPETVELFLESLQTFFDRWPYVIQYDGVCRGKRMYAVGLKQVDGVGNICNALQ